MADASPKVKLQPTCDQPEASRRCTAIVHRISISQAIVGSALEVPKVSDKLANEVLRSHLTGETGLADVLSGFIVPLDPAKPLVPAKTLEIIAEGLAKQAVINTEMVIAAAVVVLSHSTADDVFTAALEIAIDLDPNAWLEEINLDRKISLKGMHMEGVEAVLAGALRSFRGQLGRKSLPTRAALLFRHIRILHNSKLAIVNPSLFRMGTLKDADDLRVKVVHGTGLPKIDLGYSKSIMEFLHEAAFTAIRSVGGAFGLPLDMEFFKQLATSPAAPAIVKGSH